MLNYQFDSEQSEDQADDKFSVVGGELQNPFPGLRPFGINECHLFFGRESQVDEILLKLSKNRFATILGFSGSGKSSLMYCGVMPVLFGGFVTETGPNWNVVVARPGNNPIDALAEAFTRSKRGYLSIDQEEEHLDKKIISSILRSGRDGLVKVASQFIQKSGENILIFVDQFEELFRFKDNEDAEGAEEDVMLFVSLLIEAATNQEVPIYLAITLRSDFIGECSKFPGFTKMVNVSNYLIPQMTRDQKRMAVEGPVAVGGGRITERLVKKLLSEVGDGPDQLPILQHALMRTWDYWVEHRDGEEPIDFRHYNSIGKISHALSLHANEAFEELNTKQKEIAEVLFKSITEKGTDNIGVRRPMPLNTIAEIAAVNEEDVIAVVEEFRKPGRSLLMPPANQKLTANSVIELSHESLMRIWVRLKNWVDEEAESAQMYKRLSEAAAMYQVGKTGLWRPPDLQLALNWQKKQKPTRIWAKRYDEAFERAMVFLDTSRITYEAEQKNQELLQKRLLKKARVVSIVLGTAAVIALLLFVYGFLQKIEADRQTQEALIQSDAARDAKARTEKALEETVEAQLAAEKANADLLESNETLQQTLSKLEVQKNEAEFQKNKADIKTQEAIVATDSANQQRIRADEKTEDAIRFQNLADRYFYIQLAQSMAVKSVQVENDTLQALLAKQAFEFNKEYKGKLHDPYIYNGLYNAVSKLKGRRFNTVSAHRDAVKSIAISKRKDEIFSTGSDGTIKSFAFKNKANQLSILNALENTSGRMIKLNPSESKVAVLSDSAYVQLIDLKNENRIENIRGHSGLIYDVQFIDDKSFYSLGSDLTLRKYQDNSFRDIINLPVMYKSFDIRKGNKELAFAGIDGSVMVMDASTSNMRTIVKASGVQNHVAQFSADGSILAVGDESGMLFLYDANDNYKLIKSLHKHKSRINQIAFSGDGKMIATASFDRTVNLYELENIDELPLVLQDNYDYVFDLGFSNNSTKLITANRNGEIRVWPTNAHDLANQICDMMERNMTQEEWRIYVGEEDKVKYRYTCISKQFDKY